MTMYLNTTKSFENYQELFNEEYFIDKSKIIELINNRIFTKSKYVCITRPRRFGKSSVVDMLGAYYSKVVDSRKIFDNLNIGKSKNYEKHLNKYNVINISFNEISEIGDTYDDYIKMIRETIQIFDEWDYIFNNNLFVENQNDFLEFLRNLLKDQSYVALTYMTGVLPTNLIYSFFRKNYLLK